MNKLLSVVLLLGMVLGIKAAKKENTGKPIYAGYLGPMFSGYTIEDGEKVLHLRYETQQVYEGLSK